MQNKIIESPVLAQWDITTACNFSCSFCLTNSGKKNEGELTYANAKRIVDKLYSGGIMFLRILGGEPFFRNDIIRIMQYAASKGMLMSFSTNASLISKDYAIQLKELKDHLNYFQVSLYGIDQISYTNVTQSLNGFDLVCKGIENLRNANLKPHIFWVLTEDNIEYVEKAYMLVKKWNLPVLRISPKLNLGRAAGEITNNSSFENSYWVAVIDAFSNLSKLVEKNETPKVQLHARPLLGEFLFKRTGLPYFYITCKAATTMIYVDHKGDSSPCPFSCFMPAGYRSSFDSQEKISLLNNSLKEIWESDVFDSYRQLMDPNKNPNKVFKDCPHLNSGICNPCVYTPCTCRDTIAWINRSLSYEGKEPFSQPIN